MHIVILRQVMLEYMTPLCMFSFSVQLNEADMTKDSM